MPGDIGSIGGYELKKKIADVGPFEVHEAIESATGRQVELHVLPDSDAASEIVARFTPLKDKIVGFEHVNVATCLAFGRDEAAGCHFWAIQHVEGETIRDRTLRLGSLAEKEVTGIGNHLSAVLVQLFGRGILHLGIQPSTIVLDNAGYAKLTGIGFSDLRTEGEGIRYASPEHASGSLNLDARSDIYSLGASLYFMATGTLPFAETAPAEVPGKIADGALPWPSSVNPNVSPRVSRVITKMMAIDPDERYKTPTELNLDFGIVAGGEEPVIALNAPTRSVVASGGGASGAAQLDDGLPALAPDPPRARDTVSTRPLPDAGRRSRARATASTRPLPDGPPATAPVGYRADAGGPEDAYGEESSAPPAGGNTQVIAAIGGAVAAAAVGLLLIVLGRGGDGEQQALPEVKEQVAIAAPDIAAEADREEESRTRKERKRRGAREAFDAATLYLEKNPTDYARGLSKLQLARDLAKGTPLLAEVAGKIADVNRAWDEAAGKALAEARDVSAELIAVGDIDGAMAAVEGIDRNLSGRVSDGIVQLATDILARGDALIEKLLADAAAKLAKGDHAAARAALDELGRIRFARRRDVIDKRRQDLRGRIATAREKEVADENARAAAALRSALGQFDALIDDGEFARAREFAIASAAKPELANSAPTLEAAARVAKALAGRERAMIDTVAGMKGKPLTVQTTSGARKGEVVSADEKGVVLTTRVIINGQVRGETRHEIAWSDLTPEEMARLTSSWGAAGAEGALARALAAAAAGNHDGATRAMALAASSPLAEHVRTRVARMASGAGESAAAEAWAVIEERAELPRLGKTDGAALAESIAAFEKEHGGTEFAKTHAEKIADAKGRAAAAASGIASGKKVTAALPPSDDVYLSGQKRWANYGAADHFIARAGTFALLRFDCSAVPPGSRVVKAELALSPTARTTGGVINVHAILPGNAGWAEGSQNDRNAPGQSCLACKASGRAAEAIRWAGGDFGRPGQDYAAAGIGTIKLPLAADERHSAPIDAAVVQAWLDDAANNHGVCLVATGRANARFASKEHAAKAKRPQLVVEMILGASGQDVERARTISRGASGPEEVANLLAGAWTAADWADPATASYAAAPPRRRGVTIRAPRGGRLGKCAVGRTCSLDLSSANTLSIRAICESRPNGDVAVGFFTAEAGYFESRTITVNRRRWETLVINLKSRDFRNSRTQWRFGTPIVGLQAVTRIFLVLYNRNNDVTVRVERIVAQ